MNNRIFLLFIIILPAIINVLITIIAYQLGEIVIFEVDLLNFANVVNRFIHC
jgi:hypothetical protein